MEHFFGRQAFGHAHFGVLRKKKKRISFLAKHTFFGYLGFLLFCLVCLLWHGMEDHSQSLRYTRAGFWKELEGIRSSFLYTRYGSWVVWGG